MRAPWARNWVMVAVYVASACSMWARDSVGMAMLSDGYMICIDVIITYGGVVIGSGAS